MEDKELRELERLLEDWEDDDEYVLFQYHEVGKEGSPYRMIPHQVTVDTLTKALAQARASERQKLGIDLEKAKSLAEARGREKARQEVIDLIYKYADMPADFYAGLGECVETIIPLKELRKLKESKE